VGPPAILQGTHLKSGVPGSDANKRYEWDSS